MRLIRYLVILLPILFDLKRGGEGGVLEEAATIHGAVVVADGHVGERVGLQQRAVSGIGRDGDGAGLFRVTAEDIDAEHRGAVRLRGVVRPRYVVRVSRCDTRPPRKAPLRRGAVGRDFYLLHLRGYLVGDDDAEHADGTLHHAGESGRLSWRERRRVI